MFMMMQIVGENDASLDGDDYLDLMKIRDSFQTDEIRSGVCEDDCEMTAPYIGMLPDENDKEEASPLDFGEVQEYKDDFNLMLKTGFEKSFQDTVFDHELKNS